MTAARVGLDEDARFAKRHTLKDCACVTHDGPHYLRRDSVLKAINRRMYERLVAARPKDAVGMMELRAGFRSFGEQERVRLAEKLDRAQQYQLWLVGEGRG